MSGGRRPRGRNHSPRDRNRVVVRTKTQAYSSTTNEGHGAPVGAAVKALTHPHNVPLAAPGDISCNPDLLPLPRRAT